MNRLEIHFCEVETATSVMREVAAWGREQGYRVWPDEWLTKEELITPDAQPENFCIGMIDGEIACAFILQWADSNFWPNAPKYEAAYLHKFCVRRKFAGIGHDETGHRSNPCRVPQSWYSVYPVGHRTGRKGGQKNLPVRWLSDCGHY